MSAETVAEIGLRLAARKMNVKWEPLPVDSSATRLDVEDAFFEDAKDFETTPKKIPQRKYFDIEPE